jgi:hypothetical protein
MPHSACAPPRLPDTPFPRPLIPKEPFNDLRTLVRSQRPHLVAASLARNGFKVMPVHGMIPTRDGVECDCHPSARGYAKKQRMPFVPCTMPGKMPRLRKWPEFASSDLPQICVWVKGKPSSNFAVVTGTRSRVWVLDIDGAAGFESLDAIQGKIGPLPKTWTSISGSGSGAHYYWRLPDGVVVRNSANALASKIDVRGESGQIILPGSMHKSGNRYCWAEGCAPDETELVEAPPALLSMALEACKKTRTQPPLKGVLRPRSAKSGQATAFGRGRPAKGIFGIIGDGPGGRGSTSPAVTTSGGSVPPPTAKN